MRVLVRSGSPLPNGMRLRRKWATGPKKMGLDLYEWPHQLGSEAPGARGCRCAESAQGSFLVIGEV